MTDATQPSPAQIKAAQARDDGTPICMVNLLKFRDRAVYADGRETLLSGAEAYALYGHAMTRMVMLRITIAAVFGAVMAQSAFAGPPTSPVGLWKTFNDDRQPTALVRISETAGVVSGKVEKILMGDPALKCAECPAGDPRKDMPVLGMTILQGLKRDGDIHAGGTILKVADGRIAKAELRLLDGGQRLELTGRVGLFSKKTVWTREE